MHNLDAPMAAVGAEKRFGRRLAGRQTGDQIDDCFFRVFPFAIVLALPKARDAANVLDAWPVFLDAGSYCGKHLDRTAFDAPMRFLAIALKRDQGGKPARRKPFGYSPADSFDCP